MINNRSIAPQKPLSRLVLASQCFSMRLTACSAGTKGERFLVVLSLPYLSTLETIFKLGFGDWSPMPSAKMPSLAERRIGRRGQPLQAALKRGLSA